jgi:hypothetical protein
MIDDDCDVSLEDIIYLIETDKDIIGLPYTLRGHEDKYNAGFILNNEVDHLSKQTRGLMEVHGQGNGCKAIKRIVFETIKPYWFWPEIITFEDGSIDSLVEDWAFDRKARKAGFRVWCDFDRPVKHNLKENKMSEINQVVRNAQKMLNNISSLINDLVDLNEKKDIKISQLEAAQKPVDIKEPDGRTASNKKRT